MDRLRLLLRTREMGILLVLLGLCGLILLSGEEGRRAFLSPLNLQNLTRQMALLAIFAIGETFVIIAGGIDLSVGSVIAFVGVLSAHLLMRAGASVPVAVCVPLLAGVGVGLAHTFLVARLRLPPFVATLGSLSILRSASLLLTDSVPIAIVSEPFCFLGNGLVAGVPMPVWCLLAVLVPSIALLHFTSAGRHLYAMGGNEEAARLSGISLWRTKALAYCVCAGLTAFAGLLYASYNRQGDPSGGVGYELSAIAAAVIGGASLSGGAGSIVGTLLGASIFTVLLNGLNLIIHRNASLWEGMIVGGVVLAAVILNTVRRKGT